MIRIRSGIALAVLFAASPAWAGECLLPAGAKLAEGMSTVAPEMAAVPVGHPYCLPAEQALARLRAPVPASGAYVPLTKDDNTPWRFDMSQNGKRMTAEEFDAWMKARGVRVAKGAQPAATPAPPVEPPKEPKK
jgi:hypothetical protein